MDTPADTSAEKSFNDGLIINKTGQDYSVTDVFEQDGDADFAKAVLAAGYIYTFASDMPLTLELRDTTGNLTLAQASAGKLEYAANAGGIYFLRMAEITDKSTLDEPYTVTLKVAQITGDTPANSTTTKYIAFTTTGGASTGTYTDKFDFKNDADWAAVSLTANTAYAFHADNSNVAMELLAASLYGVLPVTINTMGDLQYTPITSGLYYLATSNWQNRVALNSTYTITVTPA
jgi:hypothetical protein